MSAANDNDRPIISKPRRVKLISGFLLVLLVIGGGVLAWRHVTANQVDTDNAYLAGDSAGIMVESTGRISRVNVRDGDTVKEGAILFELDPVDASIALERARANLEAEVRATRNLYETEKGAQASYLASVARLSQVDLGSIKTKIALDQLLKDIAARSALVGGGAEVSSEELAHMESERDRLTSQLKADQFRIVELTHETDAAKSRQVSASQLTSSISLAAHPRIIAALTFYQDALLATLRTKVTSPGDGNIIKTYSQLGERVSSSTRLATLLLANSTYVEANFKETQTAKMKPGQCVSIVSDRYGSGEKLKGVVTNVGLGTGSIFSPIPVQNAAGNWIKVVQRVPVRIDLLDDSLKTHPLSLGMSMRVEVDLSSTCHIPPSAASGRAMEQRDRDIENVVAQSRKLLAAYLEQSEVR